MYVFYFNSSYPFIWTTRSVSYSFWIVLFFRPLLKEIKSAGESHIVLDCPTEKIMTILNQANEVKLMGEYLSIIITSLVSEHLYCIHLTFYLLNKIDFLFQILKSDLLISSWIQKRDRIIRKCLSWKFKLELTLSFITIGKMVYENIKIVWFW